MSGLSEMFLGGGWAMWAILAIGMPAWLFTVVAGGVLVLKREAFPLVMAAVFPTLCGLMAILMGLIGYFNGMSMAEQAVELADPEHVEPMMAQAERLSSYPLYFGFGVGTIPLAVGGLCFILALTSRKSQSPS